MLGAILKLSLLLTLLWQAATINASPILATNDNLAKYNDDVFHLLANNYNNDRGSRAVKRSLHSTIDQQSLIDSSPFRSRLRHRRLRKKVHSAKLKHLPNVFPSTRTNNNNLGGSKRIKAIMNDRLKHFQMLDPDEFQEMLNPLNYQMPDKQIKESNNMDTIGGMELENYWSRK